MLPFPPLLISGPSLPSLTSFTSLSISFRHCPVFPPCTGQHTHPQCDLLRPNTYTHQYFFSCFSFQPLVCTLLPPPQIHFESHVRPFPFLLLPPIFPTFSTAEDGVKKRRDGIAETESGRVSLEGILCRQAAVNQCNCVWFLKP